MTTGMRLSSFPSGRTTDGVAGTVAKAAVLLLATAGFAGCASTSQRDADVDTQSGLVEGVEPVASAEEARVRAREAYTAGNVEGALYMLVQAVQLDPEDAASLYSIGAIQERRGNTELATRAYQQAVDIDPSHALAQQQLGAMLLKARDLKPARKALEAAIDADPTLWRPHDLLGVIADMDERYDDAIDHYSAAIALRPTVASIVNNRGYSKYLAGRLDAAEADFRLALEIDASYQRAWQNLGLIYARQQKYREARWAMEMYMPKHVAANDIGYIAMLDGDYDTAGFLFKEAIRLSPRFYLTAEENLVELDRRRSPDRALRLRESDAKELASLLEPVEVRPERRADEPLAPAEADEAQAAVAAAVSAE